MKKELHIFFTTLMFYTRIPCPKNIDHNPEYLNKATRYFPIVGWIVGGISFAVYYLSSIVFSQEIAIILSMIGGILTTGAFHEDGFADVCDGFGGGWTKEKILMIMKDSAIGAYGAIGLVLLFLLKFQSLNQLIVEQPRLIINNLPFNIQRETYQGIGSSFLFKPVIDKKGNIDNYENMNQFKLILKDEKWILYDSK